MLGINMADLTHPAKKKSFSMSLSLLKFIDPIYRIVKKKRSYKLAWTSFSVSENSVK